MKHWNDHNLTSHHITGGFWAHITWDGDKGVDQRGRKWVNRNNPQPEFHPAIIELMKMPKQIFETMNKIKSNA